MKELRRFKKSSIKYESMFSQLGILFNLVYIVKMQSQKRRDSITIIRTRINKTISIFLDGSSSFRMRRVIVEQPYSLISTKTIRQKYFKTSKMYFNYSIEQFTTLKKFYSFLISLERIETKQFVSTINVSKLWKNRRKLLKIWFEIKIFTRLNCQGPA